jgi:hypothetical protein
MYEYDLFAVINHEGDLNTGHYTNFARFEDEVRAPPLQIQSPRADSGPTQWYKFDDEKCVRYPYRACAR